MQNALTQHVIASPDHSSHDLQGLLFRQRASPTQVVEERAIGAVLSDDHEPILCLFLVKLEDIGVVESRKNGNFVVDEFLSQLARVELRTNHFHAESLSLAVDSLEDICAAAAPYLPIEVVAFTLDLQFLHLLFFRL